MARFVSGTNQQRAVFDRVCQAIEAAFEQGGMNHAFGSTLQSTLTAHGVDVLKCETEQTVDNGGTDMSAMMRRSTEQLRDKYISTGHLTSQDIDEYVELTLDPATAACYYATARIIGKKATDDFNVCGHAQ